MNVSIRPIGPNDYAEVSTIWREVLDVPYVTAEWAASFYEEVKDDVNYETYVAEADGRVVGLVTTVVTKSIEFPKDGYTKVNGLAVLPEYQGRGIGRKLLETVEARAAERGAGHIVLASGMQRTEAHKFYECVGYKKTSFWFRKNLG